MGIFGDILGGIFGAVSANETADAQRDAARMAAQTARLGFDYLTESPIAKTYLPAGETALNTQMALLGLGGDPGAAEQAMNQYFDSAGYKTALDTGSAAITGNRAARGILQSGATGKELTRFGQDLGQRYFQDYLANINGITQTGLQAGSVVGGAGSSAGATGAQAISTGYGNAANTMYGGYQDIARSIGSIF